MTSGIRAFPPLIAAIGIVIGLALTFAYPVPIVDDNARRSLFGLGVVFLVIQGIEYSKKHFTPMTSAYGSLFFTITGFHGAHVIIGSIFLIVCLLRALAGHFTPKQHLGFEFAAWYWHFVDVVWLFLFACIYVWGSGVPHPE